MCYVGWREKDGTSLISVGCVKARVKLDVVAYEVIGSVITKKGQKLSIFG